MSITEKRNGFKRRALFIFFFLAPLEVFYAYQLQTKLLYRALCFIVLLLTGLATLNSVYGQTETPVSTAKSTSPQSSSSPSPFQGEGTTSRTETVTFDFKNTDIRDVLRAIATAKGLNIVMEPNVLGTVTMHLENVPLEVGLKTLLEANGFTYVKENGIYRVKKAEVKTQLLGVSFRNGLLSLDVRDADVRDALLEIAKQAETNIVADKSVAGKVNIRLDNVPLDTALETFLNAHGYIVAKSQGIYRVYASEKAVPLTLNVSEGLVSIDVKDADLGDLTRQIAGQAGLNIIIFGDVRERVNARLNKVLLDEALSLLYQGSRFGYKREGNILKVGDPAITGPAAPALTSQKIIRLKYLKADQVIPLLPSIFSPQNIKVVAEQNAIVAVGSDSFLREIEKYIAMIDHASQQIMVEALVIEFSRNKRIDFGISGTYQKDRFTGALGATGELVASLRFQGLGLLPEDFSAALSALEERGVAKVRTSPKIATVNGREAVINVGDVRYFPVTSGTQQNPITSIQAITAGIVLKLTPWVNAANEITMDLNPEISGVTATGPGGLPEITKRTVSTTIRVKDGETIVIGGLITSEDTKAAGGVPFLSRIPVLGWLFGRTKKTDSQKELVIYITPKLITERDYVAKEAYLKEKGLEVEGSTTTPAKNKLEQKEPEKVREKKKKKSKSDSAVSPASKPESE